MLQLEHAEEMTQSAWTIFLQSIALDAERQSIALDAERQSIALPVYRWALQWRREVARRATEMDMYVLKSTFAQCCGSDPASLIAARRDLDAKQNFRTRRILGRGLSERERARKSKWLRQASKKALGEAAGSEHDFEGTILTYDGRLIHGVVCPMRPDVGAHGDITYVPITWLDSTRLIQALEQFRECYKDEYYYWQNAWTGYGNERAPDATALWHSSSRVLDRLYSCAIPAACTTLGEGRCASAKWTARAGKGVAGVAALVLCNTAAYQEGIYCGGTEPAICADGYRNNIALDACEACPSRAQVAGRLVSVITAVVVLIMLLIAFLALWQNSAMRSAKSAAAMVRDLMAEFLEQSQHKKIHVAKAACNILVGYFQHDSSQECHTSEYALKVGLACVTIIGYLFGFPVLLLLGMRCLRQYQLVRMPREEVERHADLMTRRVWLFATDDAPVLRRFAADSQGVVEASAASVEGNGGLDAKRQPVALDARWQSVTLDAERQSIALDAERQSIALDAERQSI
eukprot:gene30650-38362_t